MPTTLHASCRCGAVRFTCASHTPQPYQRCYCSICRKTNGGGGYAINLSARTDSLVVQGDDAIGVFRAKIREDDGSCQLSTAERRFCTRCGAALWLFSPEWPELVHPFASAIDSALPAPVASVHIMLRFKPEWVRPDVREGDATFDLYPEQSIAEWHREHGVWVE